MMKINMLIYLVAIFIMAGQLSAQTPEQWCSDIDLLVSKIEKYHPFPCI
ncbi:MAG: hypothetical protein V1720_15585 [bacterium]